MIDKQELKQKITAILLAAVNGNENKYRLKNGHVNWEAVEQDLHDLIEDL